MFTIFVEWFCNVGNNNEIFSGFIVIFAFFSFVFLDYYLLRHMFHNVPKLIKEFDKLIRQEDVDIHKVSELIKNYNSIIQSSWHKYMKAVSKIDTSTGMHGIDISMFFNRTNLIEGPGMRKISETIPGILTALGILGTFVGLVAGLSDLNLASTDTIRNSLESLLHGLSVAFYTSVYGVMLSVIWTIIDRILMEYHLNNINKFIQSFRLTFPACGTGDFLKELLDQQKEQTDALKHMSTDMALEFSKLIENTLVPSMGKSLADSFEYKMVPVLRNMSNVITDFTNLASQNQTEGMKNVVNSFINEMNHSLNGQFENLAETIKQMCEWQSQIKGELDELINEIVIASRNQKEINVSAEEIIKNFTTHIVQLHEANSSLISNLKSLGSLSELITTQTNNNYAISEQVSDQQAAFYDNVDKYNSDVRVQIDKLTNSWTSMENNLSTLNENLVHSMKEFSEKTHEGLHGTFAIFDKQLSAIAGHLSGTISEIQETVDELPHVINDLKNSLIA